MLTNLSLHARRRLAYGAGFFLAAAAALPAYINSTFLDEKLGELSVGLIFSLAALVGLLLVSLLPRLLRSFGLNAVTLAGGLVAIAATLGLAFANQPYPLIICFIVFYVSGLILRPISDLFLEAVSSDSETGTVRGIFLTVINLAWLAAPLLATYLIIQGGYTYLYLITALFFIPFMLIIFTDGQSQKISFPVTSLSQTLQNLFSQSADFNPDLRRILLIDLWLNVFYAIMVIYTPIYLVQTIGLPWEKVGLIFTVMLLPFVILDYPLGWLADKWLGEKEILIGGLIVLAVATTAITFINTGSIIVWALILFATRVGAASIETMKEIYLFKKINAGNTDIISLSRDTGPLSYLLAPMVVSLLLVVIDLRFIFLLLALFMIIALRPAFKLKDTK